MNILAIDSSTTRLCVAAQKDDYSCTADFDIGMKQSATIVPAMDYVLDAVGLKPEELDCTALCIGPGSFTGLRLAISALKAVELAHNVPVYGLPTLDVYAFPYLDYGFPVLSVVDANKERFYAKITRGNDALLEAGDYETELIKASLKELDSVILAGYDSEKLKNALREGGCKTECIVQKAAPSPAKALFELAGKALKDGRPPLQDYDGPLYLRASEAELKQAQS